mgnify:CR=1 FL=1
MSTGQLPPNEDAVRRIRRQVEHAIEQLASLSGSNLSAAEFYHELLRKGLDGIEALAGAVWLKSPQGFLLQQCQININKVGLEDFPEGRQSPVWTEGRYAFPSSSCDLRGCATRPCPS